MIANTTDNIDESSVGKTVLFCAETHIKYQVMCCHFKTLGKTMLIHLCSSLLLISVSCINAEAAQDDFSNLSLEELMDIKIYAVSKHEQANAPAAATVTTANVISRQAKNQPAHKVAAGAGSQSSQHKPQQLDL